MAGWGALLRLMTPLFKSHHIVSYVTDSPLVAHRHGEVGGQVDPL